MHRWNGNAPLVWLVLLQLDLLCRVTSDGDGSSAFQIFAFAGIITRQRLGVPHGPLSAALTNLTALFK